MPRLVPYLITLVAALAACDTRAASRSTTPHTACSGGAGGSLTLNERAAAALSVSFTGDTSGRDSVHLHVVFVARGQPGWRGRAEATTLVRPVLPESVGFLSGSGLGDLFMGYDPATKVAWMHDQKVILDTFNIVLVDRADSVGGPPIIARKLRVRPSIGLAPGVCARRAQPEGSPWRDSVRAVLFRSPEIRAVIGS